MGGELGAIGYLPGRARERSVYLLRAGCGEETAIACRVRGAWLVWQAEQAVRRASGVDSRSEEEDTKVGR